MRLDRLLTELNLGTRSRAKELVRRGAVRVDGAVVTDPSWAVNERTAVITYQGREYRYRPYVYYVMNKPAGVVSATEDSRERTVLDVLRPFLADEDAGKAIVPVGRLDKDTEGLLLLTNDGALTHALLSPKRHVEKTYLVTTRRAVRPDDEVRLRNGVEIGEEQPTLPARVEILSDRQILLTIHEGKFHQVKRMLEAVDNEVVQLKRVSFGSLALEDSLQPCMCRELTAEEVETLRSCRIPEAQDIRRPSFDGIEAILFDMDGTLVDSMWMWHEIDIEYLARFGLTIPDGLQQAIEGKSFLETSFYFKERFGIPDSPEQIRQDWNEMAWEKYTRVVPLKPGVRSFLTKCRRKGIRLGVCTSNSKELATAIADSHRLHDMFDCILTSGDVEKGKPSPDIYLAAAERLGVAPERCLVFEDILPGIRAGLAAGMKVCAVDDVYSADVRREKAELADYFIENYLGL